MATETSTIKRARKQASKPRLFAPPSEIEMAQGHASIDCLDVLEDQGAAHPQGSAARIRQRVRDRRAALTDGELANFRALFDYVKTRQLSREWMGRKGGAR
jgi:hypothetical protein